MGNPHAVIKVDDFDSINITEISKNLQTSNAFPESVNVGFLKIKKSGTLRIPLMYVFSVYLVFMVATIAIYARGLVRIFKGEAS